MANQKGPPDQLSTFATWLTTATSLLAGLGGAVGTGTGALNRAGRDYPVLLGLGFLLVIVAVLISVVTLPGVWLRYGASYWRRRLVFFSPIVFAFGVAIMLGTLVASLTHPPPHLAINGGVNSAPDGETLNVTIKGGGFTSSDRVHVRVEAIGASTPWTYQATVGVDPTGAVDDPITLSLPRGTYRHIQVLAWAGVEEPGTQCTEHGSRASCVDFEIRPGSGHPQLMASWTGSGPTQAVTANIAASNLDLDQAIDVMVIGTPVTRQQDPVLYSAVLRPDDRGGVKGAINIPVGAGYSDVCVLAKVALVTASWPAPTDGGCPPEPTSELSWAHLTAP